MNTKESDSDVSRALRSFVTHGTTIDVERLRSQLARILDPNYHDLVCLVVVMDGAPFESLLTLYRHSERGNDELVEVLRNAEAKTVEITTSAGTTQGCFSKLLEEAGFRTVALVDDPQAVRITRPARKKDDIAVTLIFVGADRGSQPLRETELDDLESLIYCTIQVANKREQLADRRFDIAEQQATEDIAKQGELNNAPLRAERQFDIYLPLIFQQICDLSDSRWVAYYRLAREVRGLVPGPAIRYVRDHLYVEFEGPLGQHANEAFLKRRSVANILPHNNVSFAFPIVGRKRLRESSHMTHGVIVVARPADNPFGLRDLLLLRAASSRLLRFIDQVRQELSEHFLTGFLEDSHPSPHYRSKRQLFRTTTSNIGGDRGSVMLRNAEHYTERAKIGMRVRYNPVDMILPSELEGLSSEILFAAEGLFDLTASRSVTIRFLSMNGRMLMRCCSVGDRTVSAEPAYILNPRKDSPRSANAWVAQSGEAADIGDVKNRSTWANRHPGLEQILKARGPSDSLTALYCVPIRSSGRIIGTINLESVYPHAYGFTRSLADAVGTHIGRLVESQRERSESLLNVSSRLAELMHETVHISKKVDAVGESSTQDPAIRSLVEHVGKLLDLIKEIQQGTRREDAATIRDIVVHLLVKVQLEGIKVSIDETLTNSYSAGDVVVLKDCIAELLSNARKHATNVSEIELNATMVRHANRPWMKISVSNPKHPFRSQDLDTTTLSRLGQSIVEHSGRHWGLLMVGAKLRKHFGGTVYPETVTRSFFRIAIEVPYVQQSDNPFTESRAYSES